MKRFTILFTLLATFLFFSCEDPNMDEMDKAIDQQSLITSGEWNILFFFDAEGDKARNYANYDFIFGDGGVITAIKDSNINGTWSIGEVSNKSKRLVLNFSDSNFQSLGKEWIINEITNTKIELIRFDGEGAENLVFTK